MKRTLKALSLRKSKVLFEQYEKEMRNLRNLSEHTLKGCWRVFNRWLKYVGTRPNEQNFSQFVIENGKPFRIQKLPEEKKGVG